MSMTMLGFFSVSESDWAKADALAAVAIVDANRPNPMDLILLMARFLMMAARGGAGSLRPVAFPPSRSKGRLLHLLQRRLSGDTRRRLLPRHDPHGGVRPLSRIPEGPLVEPSQATGLHSDSQSWQDALREETHPLLLVGSEAPIERLPRIDELVELGGSLCQGVGASTEDFNRINLTLLTQPLLDRCDAGVSC